MARNRKRTKSNLKIEPAQLSAALREQFYNYNAQVTEVVRSAVTDTLEDGLRVLGPAGAYMNRRRAGGYRQSFQTEIEVTGSAVNGALFSTQYQLTHLLEHGHRTPWGGMTRAFPHWEPTERKMTADFERRIVEGIENIGG